MQGGSDPFCRSGYPWGKENTEILEFYKTLGKTRRNSFAFRSGEFIPVTADGCLISYIRKHSKGSAFVAVNAGTEEKTIPLPQTFANKRKVFGKKQKNSAVTLAPFEYIIIT